MSPTLDVSDVADGSTPYAGWATCRPSPATTPAGRAPMTAAGEAGERRRGGWVRSGETG
ncbi:hypothetical protein [Microbispora bryophytorum]|uniref:Uncharacterized protein n=1 Tax=Microbispora bryophytorum subsp. camponoti TaxID=1677852 RepID=A0ABR8KYT7_9ACTN|nr:hypothetical protein [Microbispora camponoti]MBD3142842.1 hypothetical protein [Microbispora camponoti]